MWHSPSLEINGAQFPRLADNTGFCWDVISGFGKALEF